MLGGKNLTRISHIYFSHRKSMNRRTVFLCSKALPKGLASAINDKDILEFRRMTQGMSGEEKLDVLRQLKQNGAPAFLIFKIADGF